MTELPEKLCSGGLGFLIQILEMNCYFPSASLFTLSKLPKS